MNAPFARESEVKTFPPDAIDDPSVSYTATVVDTEDSGSEQTAVESADMGPQQHLALVTQEDGTQQQVTDCGRVTEGEKGANGIRVELRLILLSRGRSASRRRTYKPWAARSPW